MKILTPGAALLGVLLVLHGPGTETTASAGDIGVASADVTTTPATVASAAEHTVPDVPTEELTAVVRTYCQVCHNDQLLTGNISMESFAVENAAEDMETAERMIRKLRAGMMPPPGMPRPGGDTLQALVETLEKNVDDHARRNPNPGMRTFQRLNRTEYSAAIREMLNLEVDAGVWLPLDQMSENFDNIADVQALTPTHLDAFLNAASEVTRLAVGSATVDPTDATYNTSPYGSQHAWEYVEGAPYGSRGGIVVTHDFPADGEYIISPVIEGGRNARYEDVDISIEGEPIALLAAGPFPRGGADFRGGSTIRTSPTFIRAGQKTVSAAFVRRIDGPYEDLIKLPEWSMAGGAGGSVGQTMLPHLRSLIISGPYNVTGVSETEARKTIFSCRPTSPAEERPCARSIIDRLGGKAYRRPLDERDLAGLMIFYDSGSEEAGFEVGVRRALQAILASPHFIFRIETQPEHVKAGERYELDDFQLATRMSAFLWGTLPDDELIDVASRGKLSDDKELERQVRRMLTDPRAEALGPRFAAQWFRLQDLEKVHPDPYWFPNYSQQLADAMRTETEMFFNSLVREDRSVLGLFTADYTYINERLAKHYGIPGVIGDEFRRVEYPDARRGGVLGHGSILVLTSMGTRTSPVLRGKWVMEVLLGTPPPPPPPNVPTLDDTEGSADGRFLTTRQRMEKHRANPVCYACHQFMDPMGLALDNFDVTGQWRIRENNMPLDTRGNLYDGTPLAAPDDLRAALRQRPIPLIRTFTTNLLAYAIGRRVEYHDQTTVRQIAREGEENGYSISSFIVGVVMSDPFRMRMADVVAEDAANGGS